MIRPSPCISRRVNTKGSLRRCTQPHGISPLGESALTFPEPSSGVTASTAFLLLAVEGLPATPTAQGVRLGVAFTKAACSLAGFAHCYSCSQASLAERRWAGAGKALYSWAIFWVYCVLQGSHPNACTCKSRVYAKSLMTLYSNLN